MKTDSQLQKDVMDEIRWEPSTQAAHIGVSASNGIVTLNGTVATYAEKLAAERATQRVEGVKGVAQEITIKLIGDHVKTDPEIADAAVIALQRHTWVPTNVQATVDRGWVTLTGQASWAYERTAACDAICFMPGVRGVSNDIVIQATIDPSAVKESIERAFVRNAEIDAGTVKVTAKGGVVTLTGHVRSWNAKDQAESAAWNAPGVNSVRNDLTVTFA